MKTKIIKISEQRFKRNARLADQVGLVSFRFDTSGEINGVSIYPTGFIFMAEWFQENTLPEQLKDEFKKADYTDRLLICLEHFLLHWDGKCL